MVRCKVVNCRNTTYRAQKKNLDILFHSFPKDKQLRDKWINKCGYNKNGIKITKHSYVCSAHFEENDYGIIINDKCTEKVLFPTATPTQNLNYINDATMADCRSNQNERNEENNENLIGTCNESSKNRIEILSNNVVTPIMTQSGVPILIVNQDNNLMSIIKTSMMKNLITINGEQYQLELNQDILNSEEPQTIFVNNSLVEEHQLQAENSLLSSSSVTIPQVNQQQNLILLDYPTLLNVNDNHLISNGTNNLPYNLIQTTNTNADNDDADNNKEQNTSIKMITANKSNNDNNIIHANNTNEFIAFNNQNSIITNKIQNNKKKLKLNNKDLIEVKPISEKLLKTKLIEVESVNNLNNNNNIKLNNNDIISIKYCDNNNNNSNDSHSNKNIKSLPTITAPSPINDKNEIDFEDFIPTFQIIDSSNFNN